MGKEGKYSKAAESLYAEGSRKGRSKPAAVLLPYDISRL